MLIMIEFYLSLLIDRYKDEVITSFHKLPMLTRAGSKSHAPVKHLSWRVKPREGWSSWVA